MCDDSILNVFWHFSVPDLARLTLQAEAVHTVAIVAFILVDVFISALVAGIVHWLTEASVSVGCGRSVDHGDGRSQSHGA